MGKTRRVILLGLDGVVPHQFLERADRGELPNIAHMIQRGLFALALPLPSGVTPVNWLSVATGAHPGTHGVSEFCIHEPGTPFNEYRDAFGSDVSRAEFVWDALAREGMRTATISFPCAIPRTNDLQHAIGNNGAPGDGMPMYEVSSSQCVATPRTVPKTENTPLFEKYTVTPIEWAVGDAAFEFPLLPEGEAIQAKAVVVNSAPHLALSRKNTNEPLCMLAAQTWSPYLQLPFEHAGRKVTGAFRFYLTHLNLDRREVILFIAPIYYSRGFSDPPETADELVSRVGPYCETLSVSKCSLGWYDPTAFIEDCRQQILWQARASLELVNAMGFSLVMAKWHAFDKLYHTFFHKFDPASPHHHAEDREEWEDYHRRLHEVVDEAAGLVLYGVDEETAFVIVSDHGLVPASHHLWVNNFLAHHGFIVVDFDADGKALVDWSRTRAYCAPFTQIWVNLKGRDPLGCVEPGEEYERVRSNVVRALRDWKNDETGDHVIDEVFRVEDGAFYGLWGDRDGDVRFFTEPGYSVFRTTQLTREGKLVTRAEGYYKGDHGNSRPSKRFGLGSETALFGIWGAGVAAKGARRIPIKLTDVAPTLCALLGVAPPEHSEGAVIRDCLA